MTPPAAVVAAMAVDLEDSLRCIDSGSEGLPPKGTHWAHWVITEALADAAEAGWVLVAKADVEEAARVVDGEETMRANHGMYSPAEVAEMTDLALRLRSALGNGGGG